MKNDNESESGGTDILGPLEPLPGEKPLKDTDTADQILSRVKLTCDDDTGVFFFRYERKLYMRIIEVNEG